MKKSQSTEELSRKLQSLIILCQESAEHGEMDSSIYADVLQIISDMTTELMQAINEKKSGVAA